MADDKEVSEAYIDDMTIKDQGHEGKFVSEVGGFSIEGTITCEDGTIIDDDFTVRNVFEAYNMMESTDTPSEDTASFELDMTRVQVEAQAMPPFVTIETEVVKEYDRNLVVEDISPMSVACDAAKNKDGQER